MPTRREVLRKLDSLETPIAAAFAEAVRNMRSRARVQELAAAIEAGDMEQAFRMAGIRDGGWAIVTEAVRRAYREGGELYAADAPSRLGFEFNMNNPRAERWLQTQAAEFVREVSADQRESLRRVATSGMRAGQNPNNIALDIVGRVDRRTGRREGGLVGLTSNQASYVQNARDELTSGDPARMRGYLDRKRRDKRFDGLVRRHIKEGKPLSQADANRLTGRYADRLLKTRGEAVARTEALTSLNAAAQESLEQAVDEGLVRENRIQRVWEASMAGNTRDTHEALNGSVVGLREAFASPSGAQLMFPGDPRAPASEIINCFAPWSLVAVSGLKGAVRSHYVGDLVKVSAGGVVDFTVTPNHPILTKRGWVGAGFLVEGDQLVDCGFGDRFIVGADPQISDAVSRAEDLYNSAESLGVRGRAGFGGVNFHGEVPTEDVDVVSLDWGLRLRFDSEIAERFSYFTLTDTDISLGRTIFNRIVRFGSRALALDSSRPVGRFGSLGALSGRHESGRPGVAFGLIGALYAKIVKAPIDRRSANLEFSGNAKDGVSGLKKLGYIIEMLRSFLFGASHALLFALFNPSIMVRGKAEVIEATGYEPVRFADAFGDGGWGLTGPEKFTNIPKEGFPGLPESLRCGVASVGVIERFHYEGPVYNFETDNGLIVAGNTIAHNCRCSVRENVDWVSE